MPNKSLTEAEHAKLLSDTSDETRAKTAAKIAQNIFRIMGKDTEVRVREALSQNLKEKPNVPHDIAVSLAKDVDSVSLPVLQFSEVLSDADLIEIVRSQDPAKPVAIAQRSSVSEFVSSVLVDTENSDVVMSLVSNEGLKFLVMI
jgi:uncharacterized protein (DUF2336 family)